jgi:hypothetical protein
MRLKELAMPDLDLIKQEEQGARDRRGWLAERRSGNPVGRPRGSRDSRRDITWLPGRATSTAAGWRCCS